MAVAPPRRAARRRDRQETGDKAQRIGVFSAGGKQFAVLTERLWQIHYTASRLRLWHHPDWPWRRLRAAVEAQGTRVPQWVFGKHNLGDWFRPWLLRAKIPEGVEIAPPTAIAWARRAWDHSAHCRNAEITWDTYRGWLKRGLLPSLGWLKWLYGAKPPDGCFVVSEVLQRLRAARSSEAICKAAHVSEKTYQEWRADKAMSRPLDAALDAASKGGQRGALADCAEFGALRPAVQDAMWRVAQGATITACCGPKRAKFDPTLYTTALKNAGRLRCREQLERYVAIEERGKAHKTAGLIDRVFFIPSPAMLRLRRAALSAAAMPRTVSDLQKHPAFDLWFVDWTIPRPMRGQRFTFPLTPERPAGDAPAAGDGKKGELAAPPTGEPKGRGRPVDEEARERNEQIREAFRAGRFASIAELARHFHVSRGRASNVIHGRD